MSFLEHGTALKTYPATLLLPGFQARGMLQVLGILQTYINDEQKGTFALRGVDLHGLDTGNPATSMQLEDLYIPKSQCHALALDTMPDQEQAGLMASSEPVVIYTSHYAIQGNFHKGADTQIGELIDSVRATFMGVTNAQFFPLFRPQAALIQQAPLVYVRRTAVQMFHGV